MIKRRGVPSASKTNEFRVVRVPSSVRELTVRGYEVIVQSGTSEGICATDADYVKSGARVVPSAEAVLPPADMILKVKEPRRSSISVYKRTRSCSLPAPRSGCRTGQRSSRLGRDRDRLRNGDGRGGRPAAPGAHE